MRRFLAIEPIPPDTDEAMFRQALRTLDEAADALGVKVKETLFSMERGQAYSLFEADTSDNVRAVHARVGIPSVEVFPVEQVYTELLSQPRRSR